MMLSRTLVSLACSRPVAQGATCERDVHLTNMFSVAIFTKLTDECLSAHFLAKCVIVVMLALVLRMLDSSKRFMPPRRVFNAKMFSRESSTYLLCASVKSSCDRAVTLN